MEVSNKPLISGKKLWLVRAVVAIPFVWAVAIIWISGDAYALAGGSIFLMGYSILVWLLRPLAMRFFVPREQWGVYLLFCFVPFLLLSLDLLWGNFWYQVYPALKLFWLTDVALYSTLLVYATPFMKSVSVKTALMTIVVTILLVLFIHQPLSRMHSENERALIEARNNQINSR